MNIPRIMLAAAASGSGKTLITCGLLQALMNRGCRTASFKCGPDYIDPMFHTRVIGIPSRNLDPFFCDADTLRYLLGRQADAFDVSVLEGVMGYYDGLGGTDFTGSSYDLARITDTPVILIVNARGMSRTVSAVIRGIAGYREDSHIAGVILNRMSGSIYPELKALIEEECGIPVVGYVPPVPELVIESRHLGLVTPNDVENLRDKLNRMAAQLEETVDINRMLELAREAAPLEIKKPVWPRSDTPVRIGTARDEAFCFYYEDNLELFRQMGAELVPFSPRKDASLPEDLDGVIFPGGYPELYAGELSANTGMLRSVKEALSAGLPCLAECGGFMYLHREMEDMDSRSWPMVGFVDGRAYRTRKLGRFGYVTLTASKDQILGPAGISLRAHEFHYFDSTSCGDSFTAKKPLRKRSWECIHADAHSAVGFPHLYYPSCPEAAWNFIQACVNWKKRQQQS